MSIELDNLGCLVIDLWLCVLGFVCVFVLGDVVSVGDVMIIVVIMW